MFRAVGPKMRFNFQATVVCLLLHTKATHCIKQDDDKSSAKDFASFLKQFGDKQTGEWIDKVADFKGGSHFDDVSGNVRKLFETGKPQEIGYGFTMGYCSGFCVKKVSKVVALFIGGSFIGLQALSYNGFINIDYDGVQKKIENEMDLNHDGKVDADDAILAYNNLHKVLSFNMPSGGGFAAGLLMGLRG